MTGRELRKLRRSELLEMLIESERKNEALREENEALKQRITAREIKIGQAGSIAEAALQLSGIFEAAQDAAARYLENIRTKSKAQEDELAIYAMYGIQEKSGEVYG